MRRRWLTRTLATAVAVVALGGAAGAAPAAASGDFPIAFSGQTSLTIEYGEAWFFQLTGTPTAACACDGVVTILNGATGKVLGSTTAPDNDTPFTIPLYSQIFNLAPMSAGKHSVNAEYRQGPSGSPTARTDVAAQLTVTPAKLTTTLTVTADPVNPANVVLSASLSGRFVEELDYFQDPVSAPMPAGTWTFTGTNDLGKVVYASTVVQDAGIESSASKYWLQPTAGTEYVVEASFAPDPADAANFAITKPENVVFTVPAPDEEEAPAIPSPGDDLNQEEGGPTDPSVPTWAVWLYAIALLAIIGATVFLFVRSRRGAIAPKETIPA